MVRFYATRIAHRDFCFVYCFKITKQVGAIDNRIISKNINIGRVI